MNKTISPLDTDNLFDKEYVPTQAFMEYLANNNPLPYKSEMSFAPFLKRLDSMAHSTCNHTKDAISPMFTQMQSVLLKKEKDIEKVETAEMQKILGAMFPYMFLNNQSSFIGAPFKKKFVFQTPGTIALFNSGEWLIKVDLSSHEENMITTTIRAGAFLLKRFYNIEIDDFHSQTITFKNIATGLEKHFEIRIKNDFINAIATKPLKKLSQKTISKLLNNIYNETLWLEAFPAENFTFEGFLIGTFYDVTGIETMSLLKNKMTLTEDEAKPDFFFPFINQQLKNYLSLPDLEVGMVMVTFEEFFQGESFSLSGTNNTEILKGKLGDNSVYERAFIENRPLLFEDIPSLASESEVNKLLLNNNIKSLILLPVFDSSGELSSIFEIGSPKTLQFNALTLLKLKEFFELMKLASENYLRDMDNMISTFIQQQFTSIHQSVQWKFKEVATKYQVQKGLPDSNGVIEPIVFKDIYPLYGQADIVSSSILRNKSIQADLNENLKRVRNLMMTWGNELKFHLMESYILKIDAILTRLEKEFISSDESLIVDLLTREIHPLLAQLHEHYDKLPNKPYQEYLSHLDPTLGIVYLQRKAYEQSVSQLNSAISTFLDRDDQRMQKILPHFFEKYKTDGIEYNIYIGESLLKDGGFSPFFLKDFRIWQLVNACEITQLVEKLSPKLPVPLKTAQLIFVYNNSLSIRFRMDEKQFDVDGSYNVRYEILKKRIDKAVIKNTGERLTVAGKVAIVYLQDKDRNEYLEYLDYLIKKGYVTPDIEDLELDKLQGAEGLKALRVTVSKPKK